jgi:hypothetical protein
VTSEEVSEPFTARIPLTKTEILSLVNPPFTSSVPESTMTTGLIIKPSTVKAPPNMVVSPPTSMLRVTVRLPEPNFSRLPEPVRLPA